MTMKKFKSLGSNNSIQNSCALSFLVILVACLAACSECSEPSIGTSTFFISISFRSSDAACVSLVKLV